MNCEDFEQLMADALGGELAPQDRQRFEAHVRECESCRREYESSEAAIVALHQLPGPRTVSVQRDGDRLFIELPGSGDRAPSGSAGAPAPFRPRAGVSGFPRGASLLRYAAGLAIAFVAGYLAHSGATSDAHSRIAPIVKAPDGHEPLDVRRGESFGEPTLRRALFLAHSGRPGRSTLAACMIAMARRGS